MWGVEPKTGRGMWGTIKDRFFSLVAVLGTGFLLLVSLVLSAGLAAIGKMFTGWLPAQEAVLHGADLALSFGVITALFAMMFKSLPDAKIAWRDVWIGAGLTSLLFTIGKFLIGLYLGKADVGSAYGAAGSLVILLVWVYYSARSCSSGRSLRRSMPIGMARVLSRGPHRRLPDDSPAACTTLEERVS